MRIAPCGMQLRAPLSEQWTRRVDCSPPRRSPSGSASPSATCGSSGARACCRGSSCRAGATCGSPRRTSSGSSATRAAFAARKTTIRTSNGASVAVLRPADARLAAAASREALPGVGPRADAALGPVRCCPPVRRASTASSGRLGHLPARLAHADLVAFERRLAELREKVVNGQVLPPSRPVTLEEFAGPWFERIAAQVELGRMSPLTYNKYEGDWRRHLQPAFGKLPLGAIDQARSSVPAQEDRRGSQREHRQGLAHGAVRDAHRRRLRGAHREQPAALAEPRAPPRRQPPRRPRPQRPAQAGEVPRGARGATRCSTRHPSRTSGWCCSR